MESLVDIPDACFDIAVSYVTLVDVFDMEAVVREAHRILRPGGRFIVCNLQPMVTAGNGWVKHWSTKLFFKLDDYFDESARTMPLMGHTLTNVHRTLSTYMNTFLKAGFILDGLVEPKPTEEQARQYPGIEDNQRVPLFIIYELSKS